MTKVAKNFKGQVRISAAEKALMDKTGLGFTRIFRIGLDTLKLSIQSTGCPSCVYLYNTGENRAPPDGASLPCSEPVAHPGCCPACPIRSAFRTVPHQEPGQKENDVSGPDAVISTAVSLSNLQKSPEPGKQIDTAIIMPRITDP
jgi:hypothetical protein